MRCGMVRNFVFLAMALALGASAAWSQITYELLTGSSESNSGGGTSTGWPINTWYHDCRTEQLYLASDLTAAGMPGAGPISSIAFKCYQAPGMACTNVRIRIKGTTSTTVTGTYQTGYTLVYGPTTIQPSSFTANGWYTFTFSSPWTWNGTDNILVDYTMDGGSYVSGGGIYVRNLSTARSNYGYSDSGYTWDFATMCFGTRTQVPSMQITQDGLSVITPANLPTAAVQTAYSTDIQASQGQQPYTWSTVSGSLPTGLSISQVSVSGINRYRIQGTPAAGTSGNYTITVRVTDGVSNTATKAMSLYVSPPPAAMPFTDTFSGNTNWQLTGGWSRGVAVAYSATGPNRTEPGSDYTTTSSDNMILGHNRGADYANSMSATDWATSPPINCVSATNVRLRFWRWLGVSPNDNAQIQVTNNGSTWTNVWTSPTGSTINDSAWVSQFYDITTVAAGNPVVQVRFGIGPTDGTIANVGWCIDDMVIEQPTSDMIVQETGATGPVITDNQAVGGGRDFGIWNVSQTSAPLTIYITNNGPTNITFGSITKTGPNPTDFYLNASAMVNPLPVGQSTSFTLSFYRTSAGISTATINVPHDALYSGSTPFEINVRGEAVVPNPILQVNTGSPTGPQVTYGQSATGTARDFGNQDIGAGPTAAITLYISNVGTGSLTLNSPVMGGTWWTEYVINAAGMVGVLTAGQSTSFTVAFDPSSIGSKPAIVNIPFAGGSQLSPFQVPVLGNGTSSGGATLEVHTGSATGPTFNHNDPATGTVRDFGNQLVAGGATAPLTITIENSGGAAMTLSTPVLGGTNASDFVLNTAGFQTSLNPGGNTSFTIAFDPASVGVKVATVTFTHNDINVTSPFIINVRGNGVTTAPAIEVRENGPTGAVLPNPAPATGMLDFGTQDVNSGPTAAVTIYVANTGTASLTVGIPGFQSPSTEFQLQVTGFAGTIAPAASATFTITFDPTTAGTHTAAVQFTHNDASAGSPFVLNLTGDGVLNSPRIEMREGTTIGPVVNSGDPALGTGRDCGSMGVSAGSSVPVVVVIMNTGTQNLNMGMPTLGGTNAADFQLLTGGFTTTVAPAGNTSFAVSFDPNLAGIKDCTVQFTHDDPGQTSPFLVNFAGTATDPTAVTITTPSLPGAIPDVQYGPMQIVAIQGTAPYVWSIYSGNLPGGLGLSSSGVLSGTPSGFGGTFNVIIRVQDQTGATNERPYTIVVSSVLTGKGRAPANSCASGQEGSSGLLAILAAIGVVVAGLRMARRNA